MYKKIIVIALAVILLIGCSLYPSTRIKRYKDFSYQYLSDNEINSFVFASGVGGWATYMAINADGSFSGTYEDYDTGSDNQNLHYYCKFSGQLGELEKVDKLTYKTRLVDLSLDHEAGTKKLIGDELMIYTKPYGIGQGGDLYFYLPGTPTKDLSEEAISWLNNRLVLGGYDEEPLTQIPCCVLYETETGYTWNN